MRNRLLFLSPSAYPLGGVAIWLDYLLPGLEAAGWSCRLALTAGDFHDVDRYLKGHPWHDVVTVSNRTGSPQGRLAAIEHLLARDRRDVIIGVNVVSLYMAAAALRVRGRSPGKVVMALHALQREFFGDCALHRAVLDAVIAPNRLAVRLASEALGHPERCFYAPCGVPLPEPAFPAVDRPHDHRELRLIYSGRIEQEQKRVLDLPVLAKALERAGTIATITVAGDGPDLGRLRTAVAREGLEGRFRFLGALQPAELTIEYRSQDALLVLSEWETGPIVAWEAMSHGLPVVTSSFVGSGLEDALRHEQTCMMFPVGDMNAAAVAVRRLLDPALSSRLISGGRALVRDRYSKDASVKHWSRSLETIIDLPALPRPPRRHSETESRAGRLDQLLGARLGERLRRGLGRRFAHAGPGGEWPHAMSDAHGASDFLEEARSLDIRVPPGPPVTAMAGVQCLV